MAQLEIRLLGAPTVLVDGEPVAGPKGAKPWGLLAYLASTRRAHPRAELAELLFGEAVDPLGALRWNLAALRRALSRPDALKGDAISLDVVDAVVDVQQLDDGCASVLDLGGVHQLLAGLSFPDSPLFEMWLTGERARLLRKSTSLLREVALRALASGNHEVAVRRARELVSIDPLDEGHHALLIRALALSGDASAARSQYEQCRALLRGELGVEPGPAVVAAAHLASGVADTSTTVDVALVDARLTIAWQSFLAGSVDHGIDLGRSVVAIADESGDTQLQIMARLFFAAMLSIAVRGWDESATATTEALQLAEQLDRPFEQATARGVLAGIDIMRADYRAAMRHAIAGVERGTDAGSRALGLAFVVAVEADTSRTEQAARHAAEAVALAEESADPIRIVYATAYAGHAFLLAGDIDRARPHFERAVEAAAPILVLLPWPLALLAETEVRAGDLGTASALAARAGAISATTNIAYQRALALRVEALIDSARGDHDAAVDRLLVALAQARRTTGEGYTFHWPVAWILESLARVSLHTDAASSQRWAETLLDHASAVEMRTFIDRATGLLTRAPTHD